MATLLRQAEDDGLDGRGLDSLGRHPCQRQGALFQDDTSPFGGQSIGAVCGGAGGEALRT